MSPRNKKNSESKTFEYPDLITYNIPIKGYVGYDRKTIFYVRITEEGTILEYSCKNIHNMVVVTPEEIQRQIKNFLTCKRL